MAPRQPRDIVQAQIDAAPFYADGTVLMDGADAVRTKYESAMSAHPDLHYDIVNRIALGPFVVDEEHATGYAPGGPDEVRAVLVYRLDGELISEILILD